MRLIDTVKIVNGISPIDFDGGVTTDWVSLKNYNHCTVVISLGVVGGAENISLDQATAVDGTATKAYAAFDTIYVNAAVSATDTLVKTDTSGTDLHAHSTANGQMFVIEVDAATLDVANGFDCLNVDVSTPGVATFGSIVFIMSEPRYMAGVGSPTAILD